MDKTREQALWRILTAAPVVPVLTIEDRKSAVPLARALVDGGLTALEVTLRTKAGPDCLRAIAAEVEGADVGAGTVLDWRQVDEAVSCGARFLVSPGAPPDLVRAAQACPVPFLPGVATAGEAMTMAEAGFTLLKFFPAEPVGGVAHLKALASPLPELHFCPTGGIDQTNASNYLALKNVICVGGSWVAPPDALAAGDWRRVTLLAEKAAGLKAPE